VWAGLGTCARSQQVDLCTPPCGQVWARAREVNKLTCVRHRVGRSGHVHAVDVPNVPGPATVLLSILELSGTNVYAPSIRARLGTTVQVRARARGRRRRRKENPLRGPGTPSLTLCLSHTLTHSLSRTHTLSHPHPLTPTPSHTHTISHPHPLTPTPSHTHTLSHPHPLTPTPCREEDPLRGPSTPSPALTPIVYYY